MSNWLYSIIVISYIGLLIWGVFLFRQENKFKKGNRYDETVLLLVVIFGLFYDNLIILLGSKIGEGNILESLSFMRYMLHALITPTLILFIWKVCNLLHIQVATKYWSKVLAYVITIGLILYEFFNSVIPLQLETTYKYSLLQYEPVTSQRPLMVVVIIIVFAIVGIALIVKFRFYSLLVGTLLISFGSMVSIWFSDMVMNIFELTFIFTLLLTKRYQIKFSRKVIPLHTRNYRFV